MQLAAPVFASVARREQELVDFIQEFNLEVSSATVRFSDSSMELLHRLTFGSPQIDVDQAATLVAEALIDVNAADNE